MIVDMPSDEEMAAAKGMTEKQGDSQVRRYL